MSNVQTQQYRFPQGPIVDKNGYVTFEWQQWLQNPQFISAATGTFKTNSILSGQTNFINVCVDGEDGQDGEMGIPGRNGENGVNGQNGNPGIDGVDGDDAFSLGIPTNNAQQISSAQTVIDYTTFLSQATDPSYGIGRVFYDASADALAYYNGTTNNIVHIGQEVQIKVRNSTGSTITKGSVVYISSATGQQPNISLAESNTQATSRALGVANQDIANNTNGYVVAIGQVQNFDTSAFTDGQIVYLSSTTPGALTSTAPASPNYVVHMGVILYAHATQGKLYVNPIWRSINSGYIVGQVAIAQGGTNGAATPTSGAVAYGTGTAYAFTGTGSTDQPLVSNGASAPAFSKVTLTNPATSCTFTLLDGKTFTVSKTLTLTGTDSTTMTFPSTSATIARTDSAQTFTGTQTFSSTIAGSINGNAATVTTNANLTGPITSSGNATSVASQTGSGSTFVMSSGPSISGLTATGDFVNSQASGSDKYINFLTNGISNTVMGFNNSGATNSSGVLNNTAYFGTLQNYPLQFITNSTSLAKVSTAGDWTLTRGFGCNGASAQTAVASGGALAAYTSGTAGLDTNAHMQALYNLVVAMRSALVANGIMS